MIKCCFRTLFFLALCWPLPAQDLLVAAAADLAEMQVPLSQAFTRLTGRPVRFTIGASGMLARQIESGAPYDVYLSANEQYVRELAASGKIEPASVRVYAIGRLGLWSRTGEYRSLDDLKRPSLQHLAMANPAHAPYGAAARQALERAGLWGRLASKVVFGENVRQAFEFAGSGNADAVLTSWTLVCRKGGMLLPAELHAPIRQSAGVVRGSPNAVLGRRFLEFLGLPEGEKLLRAYGLEVVH